MKSLKKLSPLFVQKVNVRGRYGDGGGLYLQVSRGTTKSWIFRFKFGTKSRQMGLGTVSTISLADARAKAQECRKLLIEGYDPIEARTQLRRCQALEAAKNMTFEECADEYIRTHGVTWKSTKHKSQWENTLATYAYPVIGKVSVQAIDTDLVMRVLAPIWSTKTETASRVRNRIELILDYAAAKKIRSGENAARWKAHLDKLLPRPSRIAPKRHHPALPYSEIGAFIASLRAQSGIGPLALEFVILTGTRTNEAICAKWSEFSLNEGVWVIPAARMKTKREHRVPLSPRTIEILGHLKEFAETDFVFAGRGGKGHLSNMSLLQILRRNQLSVVTHGFRSTFKDWASECTNFPNEVTEMALSHAVGNAVEASYRRGDLFLKRRALMNAWAEFCSSEKFETGNLVQMPARLA